MSDLGPFRDRVALHLGKQPAAHALVAARMVGLTVLTGVGTRGFAPQIKREFPFMLQHDGSPPGDNLSLFGPDLDWLHCQAGAAVLTSRTAILDLAGDEGALSSAIESVNEFLFLARRESVKPAIGMLAVNARWLSVRSHRARLIAAMADLGGPTGLMVGGSSRDPLDSARVVEGVVDVLTAVDDLLIPRTDHGGLGVFAFGALGASIGLGTGTRHFIAPNERGFADNEDKTPRLFVPAFHAWWKGSKLAAYEGNPLFDCFCGVCGGATLARFQNEDLRPQAELHSVASWTVMATQLQRLGGAARADAWIAMCREASGNLEALEDQTGLPQPAPKQLKAWLRAAGISVF